MKAVTRTCFFLFLLLSSGYAFSQTATIRGNVYDLVTRDGLAGADVSVLGTSFKRAADDKGNFELARIPAGEYDIKIENIGYAALTRHISLKPGEVFKLFVPLTPEKKILSEVVVMGYTNQEKEAGSRNKERNAANITNIISSQAMVRSPDINAANVLQRMSGITVQRSSGGDEAYAVIRGMEPRYNNTLINGIKIASPDNKNRFVQLDIIPSDILSSIEIHKSLTPEMEGDAIGGTVNMVVKDAPEVTSFKATASVGYSQLFFDEKFVNFKKSDIQRLSPVQRHPGQPAISDDFSRSNLDFKSQQAPPNGTLGFSYTQRFMKGKIGVVLADNLQNEYYGNISTRSTTSPIDVTSDSLRLADITNYKGYTQQLNNGLVAHVDYVFNERHRVNIDNFYIYSYQAQARLSEDTTLFGTFRYGPGTGQIFPNLQSYTQHSHIENIKLSGQHALTSALSLDWAGVYSEAGRRLPDLAGIDLIYAIDANYNRSPTNFDLATRSWLRNDDKDYTGILNLGYHLKAGGNDLLLKAGGLYRRKTRFNNQDDYNLVPPQSDSTGTRNVPKPIWRGNIYEIPWDVFNTSGVNKYNPNNYNASENVYAEYLMARYNTHNWEAGGGLRIENTSTDWAVVVKIQSAPNSGNQTYQDFLPSAYLKYRLSTKQALHFSYFRSISRPNYYELVPTKSFDGSMYVQGNPTLQHAVADNFDLRYELFPKGEQNIFVGVFYKKIQNPIEQTLQGARSGLVTLEPVNSNSATNYGAEAAFTKYWGRFGVTGNYTYTHSTISDMKLRHGGVSVTEDRPMQGQTDHIVNASLLYKDTKMGLFAQVAYGYQGTTLVQVSSVYQSDYYQRPMHSLAVSAEKDIHKHFTVFGKFNNLLNTASVQYVQKTLEVSRDVYKASYSIGLRYSR